MMRTFLHEFVELCDECISHLFGIVVDRNGLRWQLNVVRGYFTVSVIFRLMIILCRMKKTIKKIDKI